MLKPNLIDTSPEIMHGVPVFTKTRVPVKTLFDYLSSGDSLADFLDDFPTVSRTIAVAVLELAGEDLIDAAAAGRILTTEAQGSSRTP